MIICVRCAASPLALLPTLVLALLFLSDATLDLMIAVPHPTPIVSDNEDGVTYPTRELHLLASLKFASHFSTQSDGRQIFITPDSQLLCEHGETTFAIRHWVTAGNKAKKEGLPSPPRMSRRGLLSHCTCQTTEGLNVKLNEAVKPPSLPASLFSFLNEKETKSVLVKGLDARQVPYLSGPTFLLPTGRLCCRHGASRYSLIRKERSASISGRLPKCGCQLQSLPLRRFGLYGVPLSVCKSQTPAPNSVSGGVEVVV